MSDKENKNIILNEEEQSLLLNHDYDGIEEFDYPLPSWWTNIFIVTSLFGVFYFYYYQFADGLTLKQEFQKEMSIINKTREAYAKDANNFDLAVYNELQQKDPNLQNAYLVYEENCLSCHEEKGKGDIGPNLTDKYWLNVKKTDPETIYKFVVVGNEDNGMPAWGETLSKEEIYQAVSYILSLKDTNVPDGKEPQGEELSE